MRGGIKKALRINLATRKEAGEKKHRLAMGMERYKKEEVKKEEILKQFDAHSLNTTQEPFILPTDMAKNVEHALAEEKERFTESKPVKRDTIQRTLKRLAKQPSPPGETGRGADHDQEKKVDRLEKTLAELRTEQSNDPEGPWKLVEKMEATAKKPGLIKRGWRWLMEK